MNIVCNFWFLIVQVFRKTKEDFLLQCLLHVSTLVVATSVYPDCFLRSGEACHQLENSGSVFPPCVVSSLAVPGPTMLGPRGGSFPVIQLGRLFAAVLGRLFAAVFGESPDLHCSVQGGVLSQ